MADPRNELADIIVPVAPDMVAGGIGLPPGMLAAGLAGMACIALAAWLWHRRRHARALQAIAAAVMQRQDALPVLAARLDVWARARFCLTRLDASVCPPRLEPSAWSDWVNALTRLRFAASPSDGHADLAILCETARQWGAHA